METRKEKTISNMTPEKFVKHVSQYNIDYVTMEQLKGLIKMAKEINDRP